MNGDKLALSLLIHTDDQQAKLIVQLKIMTIKNMISPMQSKSAHTCKPFIECKV